MADLDRKEMDSRAGRGGVKCKCCEGDTCGHKDKKIRRAVRRKGKSSKWLEE